MRGRLESDQPTVGRSNAIVILGLRQQGITRLLGIAEQHVCVLLEEDGVVDGRIANTKGPLHHNHLQQTQTASMFNSTMDG